ncbi:glycosyltransferase [Novosphingobium sp. FSY-8]|uniref:Glycosyltransferase n=1 Tax=Novosphingobium ovatum TaxID=1908523 RepID=A0ABW9XH08_9SPHN|nr:bacteriohopanetetrol glucosamine biosynthesis glycosyltransferase HpnI [Novosphingobium ovatum]NBC37852.1 glycosyltransferase [Novosphingobium ovatum]
MAYLAIWWLVVAMAAVALAYQAFALWALRRHFGLALPVSGDAPAVSILKPLYRDEPRLADNLRSFARQDYAGPVQIVLATNTPDDPALPAARAVMAGHLAVDFALSTGPVTPAANGKMANCAAALPLCAHDIILLSDSDMVVRPDYLAQITAALAQPGVGAVSCLYAGRGDAGVWSRMGAAIISASTLPNMVVGLITGMARPCMGSTIAIRRETLTAMGGFDALRDVLADDHAIGAGVAAMGMRVAIPPMVLVHAGAEGSARALWRQHLRWAVTVRDLAGAGHYGSVVTHGTVWALLACAMAPGVWVWPLIATLALRQTIAARVNARAGLPMPPLWLVVAGDLFAFAAFCGSLCASKIDWRGAGLTITAKGRIADRAAAPDKRDR